MAVAAVVVAGRRTGAEVDPARLVVAAHPGPHVAVAGVAPGLVVPGLRPRLVALRHGVEDPLLLAGADVVAADVAGRHLLRHGEVHDRHAHQNRVAADDPRGVRARFARLIRGADVAAHVDHAGFAELEVGLAGPGVERDELVGARDQHDPLHAAVFPELDAALREAAVSRDAALVGPGVVGPQLLAGLGVDRADQIQGRDRVERVADHERRAFQVTGQRLRLDLTVGCDPAPRDLELRDVRRVDLRRWRVLRAGPVGGVVAPLDRLLRGQRGAAGEENNDGHTSEHGDQRPLN